MVGSFMKRWMVESRDGKDGRIVEITYLVEC